MNPEPTFTCTSVHTNLGCPSLRLSKTTTSRSCFPFWRNLVVLFQRRLKWRPGCMRDWDAQSCSCQWFTTSLSHNRAITQAALRWASQHYCLNKFEAVDEHDAPCQVWGVVFHTPSIKIFVFNYRSSQGLGWRWSWISSCALHVCANTLPEQPQSSAPWLPLLVYRKITLQ